MGDQALLFQNDVIICRGSPLSGVELPILVLVFKTGESVHEESGASNQIDVSEIHALSAPFPVPGVVVLGI